jgi:hypothetical protein
MQIGLDSEPSHMGGIELRVALHKIERQLAKSLILLLDLVEVLLKNLLCSFETLDDDALGQDFFL